MIALTLLAGLALAAPSAEPARTETGARNHSGFFLRLQGGWVHRTGIERGYAPPDEEEVAFPYGVAVDVGVGYRLGRHLALELGTGFQHVRDHETEAGGPYPEYTGYEPIEYTRLNLNRVPVTLGIRVGYGAPHGFWAGFTGGAGVHFSWVHEEFITDDSARDVVLRDDERAVALGGYAGVGFEWPVGPGARFALEFRHVKSWTSFDRLDYGGDGLQALAGLSWRLDRIFAAAAPASAREPAPAPPPPRPVDPRRWRVHARLGGFFPMGGDLGRMEPGLEGEIGVARLLAPGAAVEAAVGYFGASTSVEGASLPEVNAYPLTVGMRGIAPVGEHLEASVFGGLGLHVVDYQATPNLGEWSVAPGAYFGAGLAAKVWRSAYLGLDGRLIVARATLGEAFEYYNPELDLAGLRIGATVTVPF